MKFTLSWLKDHLETDASLDAILATSRRQLCRSRVSLRVFGTVAKETDSDHGRLHRVGDGLVPKVGVSRSFESIHRGVLVAVDLVPDQRRGCLDDRSHLGVGLTAGEGSGDGGGESLGSALSAGEEALGGGAEGFDRAAEGADVVFAGDAHCLLLGPCGARD